MPNHCPLALILSAVFSVGITVSVKSFLSSSNINLLNALRISREV